LTNNIIVSHTYGIYASTNCTATARYTLFYNNISSDIGGPGAIASTNEITGSDPLFVYPAGWDYHLQAGSPAVDAGHLAGVPPAPATDIDGDPRPIGARVDIGADEVRRSVFLPVVLKNYIH
jgi:hypothetical protein